ncbi:MAG: 2-deoxyglucose-6-phosphatase [Fluviicola sp.]|nr:MAG: 2-deoxyglucose-6-phosphatase [Fluviicola sp.]
MNLGNINTVIFDMDGVLINSEPFWKEVEIKIFASVGIDFVAVGGEKTVGLRIDEVVDYWYGLYPWEIKSKADVVDEIMAEMTHVILSKGKAMKGVVELLEYLKDTGFKIGLATSSYEVLLNATLKVLGLEKCFDVTNSAQNLTYGKPHPEIYIKTAFDLNTVPEKCLVIEDSLNGVIAGKAAKMKVIAVPDGTHGYDPKIALADKVCTDLIEVLSLFREEKLTK